MNSVFQASQDWAEQRQISYTAYDETTSTNDEAKREAADLETEPWLYIASHQTQGRGRGKNTWLDTGAGESLSVPGRFISINRRRLSPVRASARRFIAPHMPLGRRRIGV